MRYPQDFFTDDSHPEPAAVSINPCKSRGQGLRARGRAQRGSHDMSALIGPSLIRRREWGPNSAGCAISAGRVLLFAVWAW